MKEIDNDKIKVSEESVVTLCRILEEVGKRITEDAVDFASHSGRVTLKGKDIEIAKRRIIKQEY